MPAITTLQSPRLRLRQWLATDYAPFAALNADADVMHYFPATLSRPESDDLIVRMQGLLIARGWGFWAVEHGDTGAFVGMVGLHQPDYLPFSPCTEVGWRLAKEYWGQGYATEAALVCLDFAFSTLNIPEVVAFTAVKNTKSEAVMRRLGMRREGYFDHPRLAQGHWLRPHVLYKKPCDQCNMSST